MARPKMWPDGKKALDEVRENGRQRQIEPIAKPIQEMIKRDTVHVFNVGPFAYPKLNAGSLGLFAIPACQVGAPMSWERLAMPSRNGQYVPDHWEETDERVTDPHSQYAAMRPLPGIPPEPLIMDEKTAMWSIKDTGRYLANELLGVGIGHAPHDSLVRRGCFVAEGKKPTAEELQTARMELSKWMQEQVREADLAWSQGPIRAEMVIRPEVHHVCAEWLNLTDRDWLRGTKPQGRVKCQMCGLMADEGIATCANGHIVNAEAYKAAVQQQEAIRKSLGMN